MRENFPWAQRVNFESKGEGVGLQMEREGIFQRFSEKGNESEILASRQNALVKLLIVVINENDLQAEAMRFRFCEVNTRSARAREVVEW